MPTSWIVTCIRSLPFSFVTHTQLARRFSIYRTAKSILRARTELNLLQSLVHGNLEGFGLRPRSRIFHLLRRQSLFELSSPVRACAGWSTLGRHYINPGSATRTVYFSNLANQFLTVATNLSASSIYRKCPLSSKMASSDFGNSA